MSSTAERATVYFDPELHRALRVKAAETDRSLSELVNEAVKPSLAEDAEDPAAFEERAIEPDVIFEDVLKDLMRSGAIWGSYQALGREGDEVRPTEKGSPAHRQADRAAR